jgi:hypothetical protein
MHDCVHERLARRTPNPGLDIRPARQPRGAMYTPASAPNGLRCRVHGLIASQPVSRRTRSGRATVRLQIATDRGNAVSVTIPAPPALRLSVGDRVAVTGQLAPQQPRDGRSALLGVLVERVILAHPSPRTAPRNPEEHAHRGPTRIPNLAPHTRRRPMSASEEDRRPKLVHPVDEPMKPISKPGAFNLNKFRSTQDLTVPNVETRLGPLPIYGRQADIQDFYRLHPDEENYWTGPCCFCNVPIKGQKRDTLHMIDEELAMKYLPSGKILRFRLALGTLPHDRFFLVRIPCRNLDNGYNKDAITGAEQAKSLWTSLTSRGEEGVEGYKIDKALDHDAFPEPKWPSQTLNELIEVTFGYGTSASRIIETPDHPGLLRLLGAKQVLE